MEFYQYDVYVGLGMDGHARVVFDRFTKTTDEFPPRGHALVSRLVLPTVA